MITQKRIGLGLILQSPVWLCFSSELFAIILITGFAALLAPENGI